LTGPVAFAPRIPLSYNLAGRWDVKALSRFEELVERIVEGSLIGPLEARVQPVEMAKRVARAMEASKPTIGVSGPIVPNDYTVYLRPDDFRHYEPILASLESELAQYVQSIADERQVFFLGPPVVRLAASESLGRHQVRVDAQMAGGRPNSRRSAAVAPPPPAEGDTVILRAVVPSPPIDRTPPSAARQPGRPATTADYELVVTSDGTRIPLRKSVLTLGRALDNDVVLENVRVSRQHAELRRVGDQLHLRDLRSTPGTFVNGRPISGETTLAPGDRIRLADLELLFQRVEASRGPGNGG
jgi:hypothetical protein